MPKRKLPHLRRFLKRMPQLALRGTTEEHLPQEVFGKKRGKIHAEPNFHLTRKVTFKAKTRDVMRKLYLTVNGSVNYALNYSGVEFPSERNGWRFGRPKNKPVLLLAIDALRKMETSGVDWHDARSDDGSLHLASHHLLRGSKVRHNVSSGPSLSTKSLEKSDAHFVELPITEADFRATEVALRDYLHPLGQINRADITAGFFVEQYLTKRMVRKAIPFIRAAMPKKKK